jgi:hypothetical protein
LEAGTRPVETASRHLEYERTSRQVRLIEMH